MSGIILNYETPQSIPASSAKELVLKLEIFHSRLAELARSKDSHDSDTHRSEIYAIKCMFSVLIKTRDASIHYPLELTHTDKPDFILQLGNGGDVIGIEHCIGLSNAGGVQLAAMRMGVGDSIQHTRYYPHGEDKIDSKKAKREQNKKVGKEVESNAFGNSTWMGKDPELEWPKAIIHSVRQKTKIAVKDGFRRYALNWLLISDEHALPIDFAESDDAKLMLSSLHALAHDCQAYEIFDRIYVVSGRHLCELQENSFRVVGSFEPRI